ncbi:MAG: hypothetical protein HKN72_11360 [Gemmatimonadetes bacterium]|nr:hypothetical protein [Gemmatimonadota bacterium]NNF13816.1 hypothetical protein [Gemmatimonadota bacterium]
MSPLTEFLFPVPAERRFGAILKWWERRRFGFNLAVIGAGAFTYAYGTVITLLPPISEGLDYPPLEGPLTVLVIANVVYLLGPMAETTLGGLMGRGGPATGPVLFRGMLTLGIGAALLPSLIMTFIWVARFIAWILVSA